MSLLMKPRSFLAGMTLSVPLAAAMAADPAPMSWPYPLPPAGWVVPAPFFAYPQPVYPVPTYQPRTYAPPAQNPYLPPRPPVGQAPAPIPVIPWPFVLPPPAPAVPAASPAVTSAPAPATPPAAARPTEATVAVPAAAKPLLGAEAQKALAQAEADVQAARAGFTLWVPAENALIAAQEAAKAGDSEAVLKLAKTIAELTRLGAAQAKYPSTEVAPEPVVAPAPAVTPVPVQPAALATPSPTPSAALASAPAATPPGAKPQLSGEAEKALAQAEADVQSARAGFTLWVPAENALNAAREAAKAGDSEAVLKLAKAIAELTRLGAEQAKYPSTEVPAKATAKKAAKPKAKQKPAASKATAAKPASKPAAKASATTAAVTATAAPMAPAAAAPAAAPVPASTKPAAEGGRPKPRKLCWQGDRLDVCPEK